MTYPQPIWHHTQTLLANDAATKFGVYGNCMQAAVASMLSLPMEAVPHFVSFTWWPAALKLYLRGLDLDSRRIAAPPIPEERALLLGVSPRGYQHAVVSEGGEIVWDPHPSRDGLAEVTSAVIFDRWDSNGPCWVCGHDEATS